MKNHINETARTLALAYIMEKMNNGVEMFALESATKESFLLIESAKFYAYIASVEIETLDKLVRVKGEGVQLRKVNYEAPKFLPVRKFTNCGKMVTKVATSNWQDGEEAIASALCGVRSGDEKNHVADALIEINNRLMWVEIKNCEGRLY
jgi:hypothetical protein